VKKIAYVFPGQGSQFVGMGKDFYDNFKIARETFEEVDDALSYKLSKIIFDGPIEELTLTEHTQSALMVVSIAIARVVEEVTGRKIKEIASFVAGHSLGEYSALCAAGAISLRDTAKLLKIRGKSMQEAVPQGQGAMAAILGAELEEVTNICNNASKYGICEIANDNCPGQIVISGSTIAIEKAIEEFTALGKKAIKLAVSAPFHCSLMLPVKEKMKAALDNTIIKAPEVLLIPNVIVQPTNDSQIIKQSLIDQVAGRVRWRETIEFLNINKIDTIVEVGAGKVLSGMVKRCTKEISCFNIQNINDIELVLPEVVS